MIATAIVVPIVHTVSRDTAVNLVAPLEQGLTPNIWDDEALWDDEATWEDYSDE